ncbi:MAG: sulfotransferase domain-containing protein [Terriglobales bacterium]
MAEQSNGSGAGSNGSKGKKRKPTSAYRKLRRKFSITKARVPLLWLRHHGFGPADVFLGSYPRSGTTWTRFTLFEILTGGASGFVAVNGALHGVGAHKTGQRVLPNGGRLINTHERYHKQYKKAIYLVRDARDVALSEFAYTRALEFFHGDLDKFLTTFLCKKINAFGPWQRQVSSWLDSPIAGTPDLLLMHYEDLRQNPMEGFSRMVDFLGVKADPAMIQRAIDNNALEQMQEKERKEPVRASVKDRFVRSGAVQGWRSKLTPAQLELIEQHAGSVLARLGYPLSSGTPKPELQNNSMLHSSSFS